ncbi:hypothetical protein EKTHUN627_12810 [Enterobacter kobei]|nr:hypothetical protein EKTHUN627_12810 [Enterobacter kobei]
MAVVSAYKGKDVTDAHNSAAATHFFCMPLFNIFIKDMSVIEKILRKTDSLHHVVISLRIQE